MRIAVLGGTGNAGAAVLAEALARGHEVRALVRTPATLTTAHPRLTVVPGGFEDSDALDRTIDGVDAVITAIGVTSAQRPTLLVDSVTAIRSAMRRAGVERLVIVQGVHLAFPGDPRNPGLALLKAVLRIAMRPLTLDGRALGALLAQDPSDWTVLRMPRLVAGDATGRALTGRLQVSPRSSVTSGDVAAFALGCVEGDEHSRRMPMIASAGARAAAEPASDRATDRIPADPPRSSYP
ncbi:MAG TPA: NAD(P)H-binding protein [Amnibacterium sp.]